MEPRDPRDLAALFAVGLSLASNACASSAERTDGPAVPEATATATTATPSATATDVATATPTAGTTASATPTVRPDDATPTGYALAFAPSGSYANALSGLELLGFVDVVDGKLKCEDKECPVEWNALQDGTFTRAAVVRKSRTLAVITPTNFFQWIGPVDTPEKAAFRAQLQPGRKLATCATFSEHGLACAPGSGTGAAVREVEGGFEVGTFDERNVCRGHGRGSAVTIGAERVTREGDAQEATNTMTKWAYEAARQTTKCYYPQKGRAYEGFLDSAPERSAREYHARAATHEAAAAIAFDRLADELERHGAPIDLVRDARLAADDERRHAALFTRAMGDDARPPELARPAFADRPLEALLLENAREGCANETYSAVVATHQAQRAPTPALRALFGAIADDEQRHADLSHRIHVWGLGHVAPEAARAIEHALDAAVDRMAKTGDATDSAIDLGEPSPRVARAAFAWIVSAMRARAAGVPS